MLALFLVTLVLIWFYRKKAVYNPYEEALSHSSYYEVSYCRGETCTGEVCRILGEIAGHRRLVRDFRLPEERTGRKEEGPVLLIHESGIYVISSRNLEGSIRGNLSGRYWIQSFRDGWLFSCRNYIYNPFLENKRSLDAIRWRCRDMPKLPYYSIAVFGSKGFLETEGYMGENRWSLPLSGLAGTAAEIMRRNRRFLKPAEVELIYERLVGKDE